MQTHDLYIEVKGNSHSKAKDIRVVTKGHFSLLQIYVQRYPFLGL